MFDDRAPSETLNVTPRNDRPSHTAGHTSAAASRCLNCGEPLAGAYCATCGQPEVDLSESTWRVVQDALSDATDLDGRVLRTIRALGSPGRLTLEFLRGSRVPYVGPLKLFLLTGAALSATWALTREVDARFYGLALSGSASAYIDTVVRGLLTGGITIALSSWLFSRGRRRLLDEAVFSLHIAAAVSLWTTIIVWLAAAWKLAWGTQAQVPDRMPSLIYLAFLPAVCIFLIYVTVAIRRVHGVAWWLAALRTLVFATVGIAALRAILAWIS